MSLSSIVGTGVGTVGVVTTNNGGHSPEFFAQRIVDRLIVISETAPEPIKAQALAYRESMYGIVLEGLCRAIASDRAYLPRKER